MKDLFDIYVQSYSLSAEEQPEFFEIMSDIYSTSEFQSMKEYIQHADITRLQHIMSVAFMSYTITKENLLSLDNFKRN